MSKNIHFSKSKVKDFLAEQMVKKILQTSDDDMFLWLRNRGIPSLESLSSQQLFDKLMEEFPEYKLLDLIDNDTDDEFFLKVKKEHIKSEAEITVDIIRIRQMNFLA